MKLKAMMLIGALLFTQSAYAHDGEDHSGGLSFIPPMPTTSLLPKPNPITPMVTPPAATTPTVHNHGTTTPAVTTSLLPKPNPIITSGNPNQNFVTSVPSTKPTALPPLLTFSPLTPTPVHNHGTTTTFVNNLLHPIHTVTSSSGGTNVSEPLGIVSVMGAMLGFMMVRRKKDA